MFKLLWVVLCISVTVLPVYAFEWPWENSVSEIKGIVVTSLKSSGNEERKLISYQVNDISKMRFIDMTETNNSSFTAKTVKYFKNILQGQEIEAQFHTQVSIGIDLSKLDPKDIKVEGKNIQIKLPPVEIIATEIDFDHSVIITKNSGVITRSRDRDIFLQEMYSAHVREVNHKILDNKKYMSIAKDSALTTLKGILAKDLDSKYSTNILLEDTVNE